MKTLFLICVGAMTLALTGLSQSPSPSMATSPVSPGPSPAVSASTSPAEEGDLADRLHRRLDQKMKQRGLHFTIGDDDKNGAHDDVVHGNGDVPDFVVAIIAIIFLTVFGAPVLIVAVIMYFGFSRNRMMHRTVRMMVEKGQPVPPALLAPPAPAQRQRSDMRRGVVLLMIGIGLVIFFGAVNDWEGGAWAIGIIPFLIGAGYLLVWKLEGGQKPKTDIPPPLP